MPGAAARQAKVVAGDDHPLEVCRRGHHPAQQVAVLALDLSSIAQRDPGIGNALGKVVPQPLQLTEVEDPWLGGYRFDPVAQLDPAEGLGEKPGELSLEAPYLAPQLGPGEALVNIDAKRCQAVSFEQIRHRPRLSVDHPGPVTSRNG